MFGFDSHPTTLIEAVRDADYASVQSILASGAAEFDDIQLALIESIRLPARHLCFDELAQRADLNFVDQCTGMTPMLLAAFCGKPRMAKQLFPAQGPRFVQCRGRDALMISAKSGHLDCCSLFSLHLDPDARDWEGATALMMAAAEGHSECVAMLLARSRPNARNKTGMTALMLAAREQHPLCVELLLPVSDINARDALGASALDFSYEEAADGSGEFIATKSTHMIVAEMERRVLAKAAGLPRIMPANAVSMDCDAHIPPKAS